jgi:hypothetical protein
LLTHAKKLRLYHEGREAHEETIFSISPTEVSFASGYSYVVIPTKVGIQMPVQTHGFPPFGPELTAEGLSRE